MPNKKIHTDSESFLNEVLKTEPQYLLPDNFADAVATKVAKQFAWESYFKEFLIYLGVVAGILVVSAAMAFIWFSANLAEWSNFLMSNISWVAGINILIIFVLFADRVLLRYLFYKMSLKST